ncbi:putative MOB kinase activator family [Helianthus annuus]|nr:putative MOB kinase activator family [Helianthus annuus]
MIIKGLFRRYERWNHVFTTFGVFWGMGTSFGCGIRWALSSGRKNQRTFRPKKSAPSGSKGAQLRQHIDATLGSGNLREAVRLPPGEDINEWLAVNLLYGTLTEFCTPEIWPTMTAGPEYEYRCADGV